MSELEFSTIFVELDCLLDTRFATLLTMGIDVVSKIWPTYHKRVDDFFSIDRLDEYRQRYSSRDKSILKHAMVTPIGQLISEYTNSTLKQVISTPFHYIPRIIVNIYPYTLTEEEANVIINSIIQITHSRADVEIVFMPYSEITPYYVKKNVTSMVMYDYVKWLDVHSDSGVFEKKTCPEVTLLAPKIYQVEYKEVKENDFKGVEDCLRPLIGLQFITADNFSLVFNS